MIFDTEQKQELFDALEENYLPENRTYLYDFFYNNCSTKVRDIIKSVGGEDLTYTDQSDGKTSFRNRIHEYEDYFPWTKFAN